jgi:phosphoglycerate kinase
MTNLNTKAWRRLVVLTIAIALLLFVPAWTVHYWQAWVYLSIFTGASILTTRYLVKHDPALLERRMRAGPTAEKQPAQRLIMLCASIGFIALLVVPAIDFRFGWSAVPLDGARITDDTRIRASLPTIRYLRDHGAEVIVCSHLGRPKGEVRPELSLRPVADRLAELLGEPVAFDGEAGPVRLLENLRFDPREEKNDPALAAELASLADLFVSDAFGTVHRAHASTVGVAHLLPSAAGLLLAAELEAFARILENPEHPFVVVIGGAKVADKIGVIDRFTGLADAVLVGGAMAFTFLAARGVAVGASKHEDADGQDVARRAMADAGERGCELVLPSDVVIAERVEADAPTQVVAADAIPDGWMGLDIGPETAAAYARRLEAARTIFWNGPMGVFELAAFAAGTLAVAHAAAESDAVSVVGGGDSVAAVNQAGVAARITHVSTGGGAALELVEGRTLPGVAALEEAAV